MFVEYVAPPDPPRCRELRGRYSPLVLNSFFLPLGVARPARSAPSSLRRLNRAQGERSGRRKNQMRHIVVSPLRRAVSCEARSLVRLVCELPSHLFGAPVFTWGPCAHIDVFEHQPGSRANAVQRKEFFFFPSSRTGASFFPFIKKNGCGKLVFTSRLLNGE